MKKIYLWIFIIGLFLMLGALAVEGHANETASSILTPVLMILAIAALCLSYLTRQFQPKNKD